MKASKMRISTFTFRFSICFISLSFMFFAQKQFSFERVSQERAIKHLLVVGILTKLNEFKRREAIRLTWLKVCNQSKIVVCKFFTDDLQAATKEVKERIEMENSKHSDVLYMPFKGGHNFAIRLLWIMEWFTTRYDYQYLLRIDNDYFLCLDRLLHELAHRPKRGLYWGYIHCRKHVVRVDEGFMILSRDIIDEALSKANTTLPCHPFGDQAVALWIKESKLDITYFNDNNRVVHAATGLADEKFLQVDVCREYLALHGAYPNQMLKYWIVSDKYKHESYDIPPILQFEQVCNFSKEFDWRWFWPHVRFEPKPCAGSPVWSVTNETFIGREYLGKEQNF